MRPSPRLMLASIALLSVGLGAFASFRSDLAAATRAVEAGGTIAETRLGPIEYAEAGEGEPILVIHGAGGGYDQGLLVAQGLGEGFRVIAPSRFGYLRTPVLGDGSIRAQADAHAALLDRLGIDRCIVAGASAGAPSAIEFALRYPERTKGLILLVPRTYDPSGSMGVDRQRSSQAILRLVEGSSDFLFWLAIKSARSRVVRFLGVPPEVEAAASTTERKRVTAIIRSVLPLSHRVRGILLDNATTIRPWPLERLAVATLIISAQDDLFTTLPGARFTAERIAGAELHILPTGGHLMVGQGEQVRGWVRDFVARISEPRAFDAPALSSWSSTT